MAKSLSRGPTGREKQIENNISKSGSKQLGPSGEKKDDKNVCYGTKKGQIKFGHLHLGAENELGSDVQSGVMLQAANPLHYMTMDNDGVRAGWTINRCPGPYEIKCASDTAGLPKDQNSAPDADGMGFFLLAENGDIVIRAPKGRIRMSALDIDIRADGQDNTRGSINLDSNQSVNIKTGNFDVKADIGIRLFTPWTLNLVANSALTMSSNFVNGLTAASNILPNKLQPFSSVEFNGKSLYGTLLPFLS
jgi:hypothetical protein